MNPRSDTYIKFRCPAPEKHRYEHAAAQDNLTLSEWLRRLANEDVAAKESVRLEREYAERERERLYAVAFPGKEIGWAD